MEEIAVRKSDGRWDAKPPAKSIPILSPSPEFVRKWVPRYLLLSVLSSTGFLGYFLVRSERTTGVFVLLGIGALWIASGFLAFFYFARFHSRSRVFTTIYLVPQIMNFAIGGYGFRALSGAAAGIEVSQNPEGLRIGFRFDLLNFYSQLNWNQSDLPFYFSVNLFALWIFWFARKQYG